MTPSGWNESGAMRDAGHDQMQLQIWRYYVSMIGIMNINGSVYGKVKAYWLTDAIVEMPLIARRAEHDSGVIVGFADIALLFETRKTDEDEKWEKDRGVSVSHWKPDVWYRFLEIKPKIYSVGAIIRQCKATQHAARRSGIRSCDVFAAVYNDDPGVSMLAEMYTATSTYPRKAPAQ